MAATAFLMSVGEAASASVRVEVDWERRKWAASGQWGWGRVPMPANGPVQTNSGKLWLMEPNGPGIVVIMDKAPTSAADIANTNGSGTLCDVNDYRWPTTKLAWSRDAAPGTATSSAAGAKVRDEAEAICKANLPPEFTLKEPVNCCVSEPGKVKTPGGATGCGQFPGWVIQRIKSAKFIQDKVTIAKGTKWQASVNVNSDTIGWEEMGKLLGKKRTIWTLYDPAKPDIRPRKGDIYLLKQTAKKDSMFAHVGMIMDSSGTAWKTADAGQGKGFAVGFRRRTFDPASGKIAGEEGVQQYLKGWVDLEGLLE